jgi:FtsZ-interacting cell division protein YlmF
MALVFKVYVGALYLAQKQADATTVINDTANKRVSMHFLRELESEALLKGMNDGFIDNNNAAEMAAIAPQMKQFRDMMTSAKEVKKGDLIVLDFTSAGTQVNINGKSLGVVDASLKKALLGQVR